MCGHASTSAHFRATWEMKPESFLDVDAFLRGLHASRYLFEDEVSHGAEEHHLRQMSENNTKRDQGPSEVSVTASCWGMWGMWSASIRVKTLRDVVGSQVWERAVLREGTRSQTRGYPAMGFRGSRVQIPPSRLKTLLMAIWGSLGCRLSLSGSSNDHITMALS
jgi:hypothetical protein